MANYDIIGNIAIIKFPKATGKKEKVNKAQELMRQYKTVKTVLEKTKKVSGRLRTIKTKYTCGEKNLIATYKENGCVFKFNVETCYFSPRLSHERQEVAEIIKKEIKNKKIKNSSVLVMFSGVAPFSIVIAKYVDNKDMKIISIELGKECCKYAQSNLIANKVENDVEIIQGDVKKIIPKILKGRLNVKGNLAPLRFDFIVMPRPNLKESFLKEAFLVSKEGNKKGKNGTKIIYYCFSSEDKLQKMLSSIHKEAKKYKRKIKIMNVKEAGDIAPYEHRYRVEINVEK